MNVFFNNTSERVSQNTLDYLFVNGVYPVVIAYNGPQDSHGLWVSYLPTVIGCSPDYVTEYARIEDWKLITPEAVTWLERQDYTKWIDPATIPAGVILKKVIPKPLTP